MRLLDSETVAAWVVGLIAPLTVAIWLAIRFCRW